MTISKARVEKDFKQLNIKVDIIVANQSETSTERVVPIKMVVKTEKNKKLYKLRDFFACKEEARVPCRTGYKKRYAYKTTLVNDLRNRMNVYDMFLVDEIVYETDDIVGVRRFNDYLSTFIHSLAHAYNLLLSEKVITLTFASSEEVTT